MEQVHQKGIDRQWVWRRGQQGDEADGRLWRGGTSKDVGPPWCRCEKPLLA